MRTDINEFLESRIRPFFFLKFVLTKQLVRTVRDERLEMSRPLQEEIADVLDDRLLFLSLRQAFRQDLIDIEDFMNVPKDLTDEVVPTVRRYHLL